MRFVAQLAFTTFWASLALAEQTLFLSSQNASYAEDLISFGIVSREAVADGNAVVFGSFGCEGHWIVEDRINPAFSIDRSSRRLVIIAAEILESVEIGGDQHVETLLEVSLECPSVQTLLFLSVPLGFDASLFGEYYLVSLEPIETLPPHWEPFASRTAPNSHLDSILTSSFNLSRVEYFATFLTGEHSSSPITTRQAFSYGGMLAAQWMRSMLGSWGFHVELQFFDAQDERTWNPNIVATWPDSGEDETDEVVILGAHYDNRQRDMYEYRIRAPGANDDGSGSTALLQIAEIIGTQRLRFGKTLKLIWFCGEEQGLLGSRSYAKNARQVSKENIVAMIQIDMVGYSQSGTPSLSFITGATSQSLTKTAMEVIAEHLPNLPLSLSNACCSDHQSFYENGYASIGLVEPGGYRIDPEYHQPGDLVYRQGYCLDQIQEAAKAAFCLIATWASLVKD